MSLATHIKFMARALTDSEVAGHTLKTAGYAAATAVTGAATLGLVGLSLRYVAVLRLFDVLPLGLALGAGWLCRKAAQKTASHFNAARDRVSRLRESSFGASPARNRFAAPEAAPGVSGAARPGFEKAADPTISAGAGDASPAGKKAPPPDYDMN